MEIWLHAPYTICLRTRQLNIYHEIQVYGRMLAELVLKLEAAAFSRDKMYAAHITAATQITLLCVRVCVYIIQTPVLDRT